MRRGRDTTLNELVRMTALLTHIEMRDVPRQRRNIRTRAQ